MDHGQCFSRRQSFKLLMPEKKAKALHRYIFVEFSQSNLECRFPAQYPEVHLCKFKECHLICENKFFIEMMKLDCYFPANSSEADDEVSYYVILGRQFANFISS